MVGLLLSVAVVEEENSPSQLRGGCTKFVGSGGSIL